MFNTMFNTMFNEVIAFLNGNTNKQIICLSYDLLAIVATLDFITSFQISLSLFYLAPIMIVTWYGKTWHGYFICFLSVFIWSSFGFHNDVFSGNHIILAWNSLIKLGIFLTISSLLLTLKNNLFLQEDLASNDELTQLLIRRSFQEQAT